MSTLPLSLVPFIDGKDQLPEHRQMIWVQLDGSYICTARYLRPMEEGEINLITGADISTRDICWHVQEYGFRWLPLEEMPYIEYSEVLE
jgi:hypothetical protein